MLISLHHADQYFLADLGFVVGFSVDIQVTEPGKSDTTDLAVEWFYPMNAVVVFLQVLPGVEFLLTFCTFLRLLPHRIMDLYMSFEIDFCRILQTTIVTGKSYTFMNKSNMRIQNILCGSFITALITV